MGISRYAHAEPLSYAAADALAFAEFLKSPRGGGIPEDHVLSLFDEQATKTTIETVLDTLAQKAQTGDTVYVYLAGHGFTKNRVGYFLPVDGYLESPSPSSIRFSSLKVSAEIGLVHARQRILITDLVHSRRFRTVPASTELSSRISDKLILEYLLDLGSGVPGTLFNLMSASPNQYSYESDDLAHGVFAHALLEGLNGKAAKPGDSVIRARQLVEYLSTAVPGYTGGLQHPAVNTDFDPDLPLSFLNRPGPPKQR